MANEIIDITRYFKREPASDLPRGAMALWGAEGERSRFALPLWRIIYLAQADRALVVSWLADGERVVEPFVVLDLAAEPARTDVDPAFVPKFGVEEAPSLLDREVEGLVVFLGTRAGRIWALVVDGGTTRQSPLPADVREDVLFLAGECAGLLFLRDLADEELEADGERE